MARMLILQLSLFLIGACFRIDPHIMSSVMLNVFYIGVIIWAITMPKKLTKRFQNGDLVRGILYTFIFIFATLRFFGIWH